MKKQMNQHMLTDMPVTIIFRCQWYIYRMVPEINYLNIYNEILNLTQCKVPVRLIVNVLIQHLILHHYISLYLF